ncbi:hypothetical protein [Hymenobacter terricola]|uniref:hypothetical protein n=1 Tax=Hymenobacter terricola TaxID=2819236 RepID=UPI001B308290|nr:hypothetical protein [Hymenobacter terricola]
MPDSRTTQQLWQRYDALMRKAGGLTPAEKAELLQLCTTLVASGIIVEGDF